MAQPVSRSGRRKRAPKLDIRVLEADIAAAIPEDSAHCMIADALKREIPTARKVTVDLATIRYTDPASGRRFVYLTPRPAQLALLAFDQGRRPEPFGVAAYAAQIVEPRTVRRARAAAAGTKRAPRVQPELRGSRPGANKHSVPTKHGGETIPLGPLARGAGSNLAGGRGDGDVRVGRLRRFGLHAMGR